MKYKYKDGGIVKLQNAWTTMPSAKDAILRAWANQNTKEKAEKQVASEKPKYTYVNPYDYLHGWREATEDAAKQDKYTVENLGGSKEEAEAAYNATRENAAKQLARTTATGLGTVALLGLSGGAAGPVTADIVNTGFGAHGLYNALSGNGIQKTVRLANQGDTWGAVKSGASDLLDLSLGLNAAKLWSNLGKSMLAGQSLGNAYRGNVVGRELSNGVKRLTIPVTDLQRNIEAGKIGWAPATTKTLWHNSNDPISELKVNFPAWDIAERNAPLGHVWLTGSDTTRGFIGARPYHLRGKVTLHKPMVQVGEDIGNGENITRNQILDFAQKSSADGINFQGIADNALKNQDVYAVFKDVSLPNKFVPLGRPISEAEKMGISKHARKAEAEQILKSLTTIPEDPQMKQIRDLVARSHRILDAAGSVPVKSMKFLDEYGQPVKFLDGNPEKFFIGKGLESFVYNNPFDENTVLKLTHSIFVPGMGTYRMGFKTPKEAMQFAKKRMHYANIHPAQLAIKPIGTVEFGGYHFPITIQPRAIMDRPNTAFHDMARYVNQEMGSKVGDAHLGNFGFMKLSDENMAPIGIDLAPVDSNWQKYISDLESKKLIYPGDRWKDRFRIHLSDIPGNPKGISRPISIQPHSVGASVSKPAPIIPKPIGWSDGLVFNWDILKQPIPSVPAKAPSLLPAQRFPGLRNFSAIGNDPVHLFVVRDRMIAKPEIMAKAMIKEGNVRRNPEIRQIGLDFLNGVQRGYSDAADKAWLRIVDYNRKK